MFINHRISRRRKAGTTTMGKGNRRLDSLQIIRGIACLMILFCHSEYSGLGQTGVEFFFVISGFVIMLSTEKNFTIRSFALKRIKRIIPIYWAVILFMSVLIIVRPQLFRTAVFNTEYLIKSLLLIPYPGGPILSIAWTLYLEVLFYFLFGIAAWISRKYRGIITIGLIIALIGIVYGKNIPYPVGFWGSPDMLEFVWGILIYYVWKTLRNPKVSEKTDKKTLAANLLFWVILCSGIILMEILFINRSIPRSICAGPVAAVVVTISLLLDKYVKAPGFLKHLGDKSYEIYLLHLFPMRFFTTLIYRFTGKTLPAALLAMALSLFTLELLFWIWQKVLKLYRTNRISPQGK